MRVLWLIAFLGSSLPLAVAADSTNRRHAPPTPDTNDADTKAEYLDPFLTGHSLRPPSHIVCSLAYNRKVYFS